MGASWRAIARPIPSRHSILIAIPARHPCPVSLTIAFARRRRPRCEVDDLTCCGSSKPTERTLRTSRRRPYAGTSVLHDTLEGSLQQSREAGESSRYWRSAGRSLGARRRSMLRTFMIAAAAAFTLSAAAFAGQGGTAEEARAMLDKAVAA